MSENKKELAPHEKRLALSKIIKVCHANLFSWGNDVLGYLYKRGISNDTIRRFNLGAFPSDVDILERYVGSWAMYKLGVFNYRVDEGAVWKFSSHKLIIPIYDQHGDPVAFIGRPIWDNDVIKEKGLPKYINTTFRKGEYLFGLNLSKEYIREKESAYIVEGNFDVITAYQNGMRNVVASSGTFFTKKQLILLSRYAERAKVLFDNDEAGRLASESVSKKYKDNGVLQITSARLPKGVKDLDEYFRYKFNS